MKGLRLFETAQLLAPAVVGIATCVGVAGFTSPTTALFLAALYAHLLFTYTYNDYAEHALDLANERKVSSAHLGRRALGWVSAAAFAACLVAMIWLPPRLAILLASFQVAGVLYSHPRTVWKARWPLGELLHALTGAGYYLGGCWVAELDVGSQAIWGAIAFAAIYTSGSCFSQLLDRAADAQAGLRTMAVVLGPVRTASIGVTLQITGLLSLAALASTTAALLIIGIAIGAFAVVLGAEWQAGFGADTQLRYQQRYRTLFAIAVAAVLVGNLASSWRPEASSARIRTAIQRAENAMGRMQNPDGGWAYLRGSDEHLRDATPLRARVFPAAHVLVTLHDTPATALPWYRSAREFVRNQMDPAFVWSADGRAHELDLRVGSEACWLEPDIETTGLGLLLFGEPLRLGRADYEATLTLFEGYRFPSGLYGTYLHRFYGERGCPGYDHQDRASLGSNIHLMAWLESRDLPRDRVRAGIRAAMAKPSYWEHETYYRSLPILAHLAADSLEHGAASMRPVLRGLLEAHRDTRTRAEDLTAAELAALVHAEALACRLDRDACEPLGGAVASLLRRQNPDGSWPASSIYVAELDREYFERQIYPQVRDAMLKQGGGAPTLEQALAHATLGTLHHGSPAESTALALKALHLYLHLYPQGTGESE